MAEGQKSHQIDIKFDFCVERKFIDAIVRRVDKMEDSQIARGRGKPKKL